MKKLLTILFTLSILFMACETEEPDESLDTPVYAGQQHENMIFRDSLLSHEMQLSIDSTGNYYYGSDSLDIIPDNNYDIFIQLKYMANDSLNEDANETDYPYLKLSLQNDFQVAIQRESYYVGLGQTSEIFWVDTLSYAQQIDNITEWSELNDGVWMWVVPPTIFLGSNGPYYNFENTEKYIGIRYSESSEWKYAWIKFNVISRYDIRFVSFAIEI